MKQGEFWDTGVEAAGWGLETVSVSIGSSFSLTFSSGGSEVSIGSSVPVEAHELHQMLRSKNKMFQETHCFRSVVQ